MADLVDGCSLFGEAQRMAQRQHLNRGADLDPSGACGDRGGDSQWGTQHRPRRLLVDFGEPDRVEPPPLGISHLLQCLRERVGVRLLSLLAVELVIPAKLHGARVAFGGRRCNA